jgi:hypothetical protein
MRTHLQPHTQPNPNGRNHCKLHSLAAADNAHEALPPNGSLHMQHMPPQQRQVQQQPLPAARPTAGQAVPPALLPLCLPCAAEGRWLQLWLCEQCLKRQQCCGVGFTR